MLARLGACSLSLQDFGQTCFSKNGHGRELAVMFAVLYLNVEKEICNLICKLQVSASEFEAKALGLDVRVRGQGSPCRHPSSRPRLSVSALQFEVEALVSDVPIRVALASFEGPVQRGHLNRVRPPSLTFSPGDRKRYRRNSQVWLGRSGPFFLLPHLDTHPRLLTCGVDRLPQ